MAYRSGCGKRPKSGTTLPYVRQSDHHKRNQKTTELFQDTLKCRILCFFFFFFLQAQYLEEVLREGYSHPAVKGIIMFVGPLAAGFNVTTLADKNFKNTPSGDVVDKLIDEWNSGTQEITTDDQGFIELSLFHGDYEITAENHITNSSATVSLSVTQAEPHAIVQVHIDT